MKNLEKQIAELKLGMRVAKQTSTRGEYYVGIIKTLREKSALVKFPTRGFSRWINLSNLEIVTKN